jgi:putative transposase
LPATGPAFIRAATALARAQRKIERWHESLKAECVRPGVPLSIEDARRLVGRYVEHYNRVRLHSTTGYLTPLDKLEGREQQIFAARDRELEEARRQRQLRRQEAIRDFLPKPPELTGEWPVIGLN